mgnify:CR=1 FL=1
MKIYVNDCRLRGIKDNVNDLQQRLQQYQKKNDEMHDKIMTIERKVNHKY